jgi:cysteine synthase A
MTSKTSFLDTIFPDRENSRLPFEIPESSILSSVGSTPMAEVDEGVWGKLEGFNFSGSIKDRAVMCMVLKMFETGQLVNGSTLVLITSGSAGLSLSLIQRALMEDCGVDLRTIIVMPKAYEHKAVPSRMVASNGVPAFYDHADPDAHCQLLFLDGPFVDVMKAGKALAAQNNYAVLDQHYDQNSMLAHKTTAHELMEQMPDMTDVVCATGTGATAAGLRAFLPPHVVVHSRPSESGAIDGLSDVNRYDNFCHASSLEGYEGNGVSNYFQVNDALEHQAELREDFNFAAGMSTGATLWLARQVKERKPNSKVAFISACGQPC